VRGLSLFIAVSTIGASAGLILGGVSTDFLSWRRSLLINVPVGIAVVVAVGRLVAETPPKPARLDVAGALTATLGSISLVYGFIHAAEQGWTAWGPAWHSYAPSRCSQPSFASKPRTRRHCSR
jgi:MFS family permease